MLHMPADVREVLLQRGLLHALIASLDMRAAIYLDAGLPRHARHCYLQSLALASRCAAGELDLGQAHANVGVVSELLGEFVAASDAHSAALAWRRERYGADDPRTTASHTALGNALLGLGLWREALYTFHDAYPAVRARGDVVALTLLDLNMSTCARMLGRAQWARTFAEHALALRARRLGPQVSAAPQREGTPPALIPSPTSTFARQTRCSPSDTRCWPSRVRPSARPLLPSSSLS